MSEALVLGGGLAGLSFAYHWERLTGRACPVVEKNPRPGGMAGSVQADGFTFDHTGHLLHLHDPYGKKLVLGLLKGNVALRERSAWIHSQGVYTRYPFQANTYGLPPKVVEDCVVGALEANRRPPPKAGASFRDFSLATFGDGICRHFMFPYNRKLWKADLGTLTTEWLGRFVPRPKPEEVLYGALTDQKKAFGYNYAFRYPLRGGTQALADALAAKVPGLRLGAELRRADLSARQVLLADGTTLRYDKLVTTLPLKRFIELSDGVPRAVREAAARLRYRTVYNLNLGVARPRVSDKHWIYFPEPRFPFYRVGFPSNFSPHVAPRGASSMYVELSGVPGRPFDYARAERAVLEGLRGCGLLRSGDRLLTRRWITIPCAYVLYDFERTPAVERIQRWLESRGVRSIGRYGAWKYSFMEEAILDGKRTAEALAGRKVEQAKGEFRVLR